MNPGRELDALIAEKVMGIPKKIVEEGLFDETPAQPNTIGSIIRFRVANYSTDIAAAWEVAEKIRKAPPKEAKEMCASFSIESVGNDDDEWWAGWRWHEWTDNGATAQSAPHAICLAALKAVRCETNS